MNKKTILLVSILIILLVSSSFARVSYYAGGGITMPISPKGFQNIVNSGSNIYLGMGVRYYRLNEFTLGISFDHLPANSDLEEYNGGLINITTFMLDFRIRGLKDYQRKFRKHLLGSVGICTINYKTAGYKDLSRFVFGFGLGTEYKISKHYFIWLDVKAKVMCSLKTKESVFQVYSGENLSQVSLQIHGGIRFNMGNW
ncbi:MAG: porin family protein [candidate division Zixibacteria bacterium]|nr:porin family protein [candidate division Zixibacteria bacterium]